MSFPKSGTSGNFAAASEGSVVNIGGSSYEISYVGGTNNESYTLTPLVSLAGDQASVTVTEGQSASNTGSFQDLLTSPNVTITASFGTVTQVGSGASGTWSWSSPSDLDDTQSQTVVVTATDTANDASATFSFPLVVNDAALTAGSLTPPVATVGTPFTNVTIFHFTDAYSGATAADYTATVTLGNGQTVTLTGTSNSNGQIVANNGGGFDVELSYTYTAAVTNQTFAVVVDDVGALHQHQHEQLQHPDQRADDHQHELDRHRAQPVL